MRALVFAVCLVVTASGCAMQSEGGEESTTGSAEQPICGNPAGCDSWLNACTAKGGKEGAPEQGVRMCCRTEGGGNWCVSDPSAWPVKASPPPDPPPSPTVRLPTPPVSKF